MQPVVVALSRTGLGRPWIGHPIGNHGDRLHLRIRSADSLCFAQIMTPMSKNFVVFHVPCGNPRQRCPIAVDLQRMAQVQRVATR